MFGSVGNLMRPNLGALESKNTQIRERWVAKALEFESAENLKRSQCRRDCYLKRTNLKF